MPKLRFTHEEVEEIVRSHAASMSNILWSTLDGSHITNVTSPVEIGGDWYVDIIPAPEVKDE
jgi:hypothetical protein